MGDICTYASSMGCAWSVTPTPIYLPDSSRATVQNIPLPGPYELLDLPDGGVLSFTPRGYREGTLQITPKGTTIIKTIDAMRVLVDRADKPLGPTYWDVTSKLLMVDLRAYLDAPNAGRTRLTIKKYGVAPAARFSIATSPV